jgi:hypothetical protein
MFPKWKNKVLDTLPTYQSWKNMRQRCLNEKHRDFKYYGARGITICDRWVNDYDTFVEDLGLRQKSMTLERINNQKGYEPDNCRWATRKEQSRNKRNNNNITLRGQTKTIAEWAEIAGIKPRNLWLRLRREGPSENILRPIKEKISRHGTRAKYRQRCRCDDCIEANRAYKRNAYWKKKNEHC